MLIFRFGREWGPGTAPVEPQSPLRPQPGQAFQPASSVAPQPGHILGPAGGFGRSGEDVSARSREARARVSALFAYWMAFVGFWALTNDLARSRLPRAAETSTPLDSRLVMRSETCTTILMALDCWRSPSEEPAGGMAAAPAVKSETAGPCEGMGSAAGAPYCIGGAGAIEGEGAGWPTGAGPGWADGEGPDGNGGPGCVC